MYEGGSGSLTITRTRSIGVSRPGKATAVCRCSGGRRCRWTRFSSGRRRWLSCAGSWRLLAERPRTHLYAKDARTRPGPEPNSSVPSCGSRRAVRRVTYPVTHWSIRPDTFFQLSLLNVGRRLVLVASTRRPTRRHSRGSGNPDDGRLLRRVHGGGNAGAICGRYAERSGTPASLARRLVACRTRGDPHARCRASGYFSDAAELRPVIEGGGTRTTRPRGLRGSFSSFAMRPCRRPATRESISEECSLVALRVAGHATCNSRTNLRH